jgi:hypothetical protein
VTLSGALLLHWQSGLTFWRDEWEYLLHRRSWSIDNFLDPFIEHLVAIPILIYRVQVALFGMDSPKSFQVVAVLLFLLSVVLLYVYVQRRAGKWIALAAILPILFLGPSWDDLLWPFQILFFGSMSCGIAALLALERRDRAGDIAATALLTTALLFSDVGIAFVAGVTVELALGRDRFRRAFIVAVPTALFALWFLIWGHDAADASFISLRNAANLPSYVLDGLASTMAVLVGLGVPTGAHHQSALEWGRPLLVLALVFAGWRLYRLGSPPARLLAVLAALLGLWSLLALNYNVFAEPTVGRYQYLGVVLLVLVAAELLRGVPIGRFATAAVLAVAVAAAVANGLRLSDATHSLGEIAQQTRGGLAALELSRDTVDPAFELTEDNSDVDYLGLVQAGAYLSAADADGSPAYTPSELEAAPEPARVAADKVFGAALGLRLSPASPAAERRCGEDPTPPGESALVVPTDGLILRAERSGAQADLQRYADAYPVSLGPLPRSLPILLRIPADRSDRPWTLRLRGVPVIVCAIRAG